MGTTDTCYFQFSPAKLDKGLSDKLFGTLCVCWVIQDKFGLAWYCVNSQFRPPFSTSTLTSKARRDICYLDFLLSLWRIAQFFEAKLFWDSLLMRAVGHCACLAVCSFVCYARKRAKPDRLETLPVPVEGFHWLLNHWLRHLSGDQWEGVTGQSSTQFPQDSTLSSSIFLSIVDGWPELVARYFPLQIQEQLSQACRQPHCAPISLLNKRPFYIAPPQPCLSSQMPTLPHSVLL